ncbi:MAG TPA: CCA tRNA nucleotidyltransferase [Acidimicrobiales bacterium]|nr:CCA tRNA nucleotidyltransferase [Acidimicrobiales bacterium]
MVPERLLPMIDETKEVAERFVDANRSLYLVGGTVRDAIAGRPGDGFDTSDGSGEADRVDIDMTTDATPDEIESIIRSISDSLWTQGKRFGTIGFFSRGRRYEITTHRAESYELDSRKPDVAFGHDIVVDLSRRDFTVNAMALKIPTLELFDPFDGIADLGNRRLRTPRNPLESFRDDPLRMLRAARFHAGYDLEPDAALIDAVKRLHGRLAIVSAERIRDELDKIIVLPNPEKALWFIVKTGLGGEFLPEIGALELEQDPIHRHKDVLAHTIAVVCRTRSDRLLRLSALFHDIGKPKTRAFGENGVSFHHHEVVGARMARKRMSVLRYSTDDIDEVVRLVELHLRFHTYRMGWTDSALRRYARDAGPLLGKLNELTRADCTTRNERKVKELSDAMDELERRLVELNEREALDSIRPELDGEQVMKRLGLEPGRDVGRALAFLLELRLEEGLIGDEEVARRLDAWWEDQSRETSG